ncbi:hypothetical protein GCM10022393_24450 [Aquimarina addita]|uniref:Rhodanese domain-containing protein n=1 Tax=Aquimarina addita TaxID=870485 RepID=A0ABP6ULR3_9FLAO
MKKQYFFLLAFTITLSTIFSQEKVMDIAFDTMLRDLLSHTVQEVVPEDIKGEYNILFLDAREKSEFKISHIENAKWVGFTNFNLAQVKDVSKDQKIIVYCSVGYRSEKIAEKLERDGFTDVSNLYGGIFEWVHQGKNVFDKKGETEKVHTFNKEWSQWLQKGVKVY